MERMFYCPYCQQEKPIWEFLSKSGASHYGYCTECRKKYRYYRGQSRSAEPKGNCEICGESFTNRHPHLDHNHITGELRGWLCAQCNHAIGLFRDNLELLEKATNYLKKYGYDKMPSEAILQEGEEVHKQFSPVNFKIPDQD
ncbi:MAG: hypothetical protein KGJ90_07420 [Patescibacteria group bacterium]|nr:hypothetical protein [Patescibacteria group bacterium]